MKKKTFNIVVWLFLLPFSAYSAGFKFTKKFCAERGLGSNWYCQAEEKESIDDIMESNIPALQKAQILNQLWEFYRAKAVIDAKEEDIEKFLEINSLISQKAVLFAHKAQRIVNSSPKYSAVQSNYKANTDQAIKDATKVHYLKEGSKRYALVMVYSTLCSHCIMQLPNVLKIKEKWGFANLGISVTGDFLKGFDENISEPSITKDSAIQAFPTLILLDKTAKEKIFLSKGLTSTEEIEDRALSIIKERGL